MNVLIKAALVGLAVAAIRQVAKNPKVKSFADDLMKPLSGKASKVSDMVSSHIHN